MSGHSAIKLRTRNKEKWKISIHLKIPINNSWVKEKIKIQIILNRLKHDESIKNRKERKKERKNPVIWPKWLLREETNDFKFIYYNDEVELGNKKDENLMNQVLNTRS